MSSLNRFDGYLMIDHRASPGIPPQLAERLGMPAGEKLFETKTLWCSHCSTPYLRNPLRTRAREYCKKCDCYICDLCFHTTQQADYVHRSFKEIAELVRSGRWTIQGTACAPVLIPVTKET